MLPGANRVQQNEIRRLADAGLKADEISQATKINVKTVKSFMSFDPVDAERREAKIREAQKAEADAKAAADAKK